MRRPPGWDRSLPEEKKIMIKTYRKQRRRDAGILTSIFYIFTLSRIQTFISTHKQTGTAFYAKEEGRQEG
ncbi:hypothetical protein [Prevotella denticola]|uniref:hypothetical protein n=1 Tax=Prevotella denticola TaxID=28129 RepID=UPI0028F12872|nr:hypothetical protein [Prevotella denticola]